VSYNENGGDCFSNYKFLFAGKTINSEIRELLDDISKKAKNFLKCDACTIWLYYKDKEKLVIGGTSGSDEKAIDIYNLKKDEGLPWLIFEKKKSLLQKISFDGSFKWKEIGIKEKVACIAESNGVAKPVMGIPIIHKNKCLGTLLFESNDFLYDFCVVWIDFVLIF
jgi:signal transduction protein with GAF and PtsI domain